ncbi:MAG: TIGR04282 family arsenosugar biosynthesis glycosyltransferase [Nitrospiraceae bacterium]
MGYRKHSKRKSLTEDREFQSAYSPSPRAPSPQRASNALIIFAKAPIPGQVKTRLCPPLTPDEAASLHGSFVLDALERSRDEKTPGRVTLNRVPLDRFVACLPSASHVFFKILAERHGVQLLDQIGEDLGARMAQAFREIFAREYQRVLVVGTDLPSLPGACYTQAFSLLADHDLVLGPSLDGGYYLIGLRRPVPELFVDIPWSTDRVFALTRAKTEAQGLKTGLLPTWRDVDTIEDLMALIQEAGPGDRQGARGNREDDPATRPSPLAPRLSARTAGVLRLLASRLRARTGATRVAGLG